MQTQQQTQCAAAAYLLALDTDLLAKTVVENYLDHAEELFARVPIVTGFVRVRLVGVRRASVLTLGRIDTVEHGGTSLKS